MLSRSVAYAVLAVGFCVPALARAQAEPPHVMSVRFSIAELDALANTPGRRQ